MTYPSLAIMIGSDKEDPREHGIMFGLADGISADTVNRMATHGRGLIACCLPVDRAFVLGLQLMPHGVVRPGKPNYLVSVEAAACTGTGISAEDRAATLRTLGAKSSGRWDLRSPGHIMPTVPASQGETDLASAALAYCGDHPIAWCDILDDDGDLAGACHCRNLANELGLLLIEPVSLALASTAHKPHLPLRIEEPRRIAA